MGTCLAVVFRDLEVAEPPITVIVRLLVAAVLGAVIGYERQTDYKWAGMRTHMLVSLGAAAFALLNDLAGGPGESLSRVIQGVATGVGFLGAGAILKDSQPHRVIGLTTAASIWVTAGAGLAIGAGFLFPGAIAVIIGWLILEPLRSLERQLGIKSAKEAKDDDPAKQA